MRDWRFWLGATVVITLGKWIWLLLFGIQGEIDSVGYLSRELNLFHPPGYNIFAFPFTLLGQPGLVFLALFQGFLFGGSISWLLGNWMRAGRFRWLAVMGIAFDPATSFLCSAILSETLFLVLSFGAMWAMSRREMGWKSGWVVGVFAGMAWWVRFTGVLLFALGLGVSLLRRKAGWAQVGRQAGGILVGYWLVTLPLHGWFLTKYGSWRVTPFTGFSFWNSTAYLWPESEIQKKPQTEFEQFCAPYSKAYFDISSTWYTAQIFGDPFPLVRFRDEKKLTTTGNLELGGELERLALRLILERPWYHFSHFVVPNFLRPLRGEMAEVVAPGLPRDMDPKDIRAPFFTKGATYSRHLWQFYFFLFCGGLIFFFFGKKEIEDWILVGWLIGYLVAVSLTVVLFLRFMYLLAPFILLLVSRAFEARWGQGGKTDPLS